MFESLSPSGVVAAALIAPPGPDVMQALTQLDPAALSDYAQVDFLIAWERQAAWVAARTLPALTVVGVTVQAAAKLGQDSRDPFDLSLRAAHAEIAAATRTSEPAAADRLELARALSGPLTAVQTTLALGDISHGHARAIWETTLHLTDAQQTWVASRVLTRARRQTVSQLRRCLRRAVLAVEPRTAADKAKQAHAERKLDWWPLPDGMAELRLIASAADILAVYAHADTHAKTRSQTQPPAGTDGWSPIDALRSDAIVDLILGGHDNPASSPSRGVAVTHVTIDLPTLLGLRDNPAELAGYGPLPASIARTLAADSSWRRLIHEPSTGALLDLGHTKHDPSPELARHIRARDTVCAFPTCNRTAAGCDLDHTRPYTPHPEGGGTDRNNLGALCRRHHLLKHHTSWTLQRSETTENATWTSPTGHQYPTDHHDHRSYQAAEEPLPDEATPGDDPWHWLNVLPDLDQLPDPTPPYGTWPFDDPEYASSNAGMSVFA